MPTSRTVLQQYPINIPSIEDFLVALSSRMELNVINMMKPEIWREQTNYRSILYKIFAADISNLKEKYKNILALLVINTIWAEHFITCPEILSRRTPEVVKSYLFQGIKKAVELANDAQVTAFGHYVKSTIHREYGEFNDSMLAAKSALDVLDNCGNYKKYWGFRGHVLNQLGQAQYELGFLRNADRSLFEALDQIDVIDLQREDITAEALVNHSETNLSFRTYMNLAQVHTIWFIVNDKFSSEYALSAYKYASVAYFNYSYCLGLSDKVNCLSVLVESLLCVLNARVIYDKMPVDVKVALPQVLEDVKNYTNSCNVDSSVSNFNVLRFLISSLNLSYKLHNINPEIVDVTLMQELRERLLTMEVTTDDLKDKKAQVLLLTEKMLKPLILRP